MEINPASTPRSSTPGQSSTGTVGSPSVATLAPDHGPALGLEPSQAAALKAMDSQAGGTDAKPTNTEDLQKAETLRAHIGNKNMQLKTYHDESSGRSVLEVSDQATGKVVSQYPSDELLRLYAALREPLVDQSA